MRFSIVVFILLILSYSNLKGQSNYLEGKYTYLNQSKKNLAIANGSTIELQKDSFVILNTYFHIGGRRSYKGKWCFQGKSIKIFDLQDINGVRPLNRTVKIDTIRSKLTKGMQLVIRDDGKFTDFFPAELTINNKEKYFLKARDTLFIKNKRLSEIRVKVEDYIEVISLSILEPTLINITVKNNTEGTLYYYHQDITLSVKENNKLYYNGIELVR